MKHIITIGLLMFMSIVSTAQTLAGSIQQNGTSSGVTILLTPSSNFSGKVSGVSLTLALPTSIGARPTVTVNNSPLTSVAYSIDNVPNENIQGVPHYIYNVTGTGDVGVAVPAYNFVTGTNHPLVHITIAGTTGQTAQVKLLNVPDGGTSGNSFFGLSVDGLDRVNETSMFYSIPATSTANNELVPGGYSGLSQVITNNLINLPIKFGAFYAYRQSNNGILNWNVENQSTNSSHFEIERSLDGRNFTKIGRTDVVLTPGGLGNYEYNDAGVFDSYAGTVYYRIKQIDRNGEFAYSPVRSIKADGKAFSLSLYPNPVDKLANLAFSMDKAQPVTIILADAAGKRITDYSIQAAKGLNQKQLNVSALAAGSYMFIIRTEDESQTVPFVKGN
jgi:Secretion system C-terminal sorting domain